MNNINTPISILELGSTHIRLSIYDKKILSKNFFFEERIDFTKKRGSSKNI